MTEVPEGLNNDIEEPLRGRLERDPEGADGGAPDAGSQDLAAENAAVEDTALEDTAAYERAVEEDTVLPPSESADGARGVAGGAVEDVPEFREPGEEPGEGAVS
jgi:hypothetical protein